MIKNILFVSALVALSGIMQLTVAMANDSYPCYKFNLGAGGQVNMHEPGFKASKTGNETFSGATTLSYQVALGLQYYHSDRLHVGINAGISDLSVEFDSPEYTNYYRIANVTIPLTVKSNYEATLNDLMFYSYIGWRPLDMPLWFRGGFRLRKLLTYDYNQVEKPIEDYPLQFRWKGQIEDINPFIISLNLGLTYEYMINNNWSLLPYVVYDLGVSGIVSGEEWDLNTFSFGITVNYLPDKSKAPEPKLVPQPEPEPEPAPEPEPETIAPPPMLPKEFGATLEVLPCLKNGLMLKPEPIVIEEFRSEIQYPLHNVVYFDNESETIPQRYVILYPGEQELYAIEDNEYKGHIDVYYDILNITGQRMAGDENIKIIFEPCYTGTDKDMADNRGMALRDYYSRVWKISPFRFDIVPRKVKPGSPLSNSVIISSESESLCAPINIVGREYTYKPRYLRFNINYNDNSPVDAWKLQVAQKGIWLFDTAGTNSNPDYFVWDIQNNSKSIPVNDDVVDFRFIMSGGGQSYKSDIMTYRTDIISLDIKDGFDDTSIQNIFFFMPEGGVQNLKDALKDSGIPDMAGKITADADLALYAINKDQKFIDALKELLSVEYIKYMHKEANFNIHYPETVVHGNAMLLKIMVTPDK